MTVHQLDPGGWGRFDGYGRIRVEVDFGVGFYNVTGWCQGLTIARGRRQRLGQFYAAQATVRLDNRDSRFSPWNPWSPYNLSGQPVTVARPNTPLRIIARTPAGLVVPLFTGWADAWHENTAVHRAGRTSGEVVDVTATDGFKRLAQAVRVPVVAVGAGELAGARIHRILDSALWPAAARRVSTGAVAMQATTLAGSALDELHATATAEGGLFYMDGGGNATFADRATVDALGSTVTYGFTNTGEPGTVPYVGTLNPVADDSVLINAVTIARAGGPSSTAQDPPAQQRNGLIVFARTDLPHQADSWSSQLASLYLSRALGAEFGLERLELNPAGCAPGPERTRAWEAVAALAPLQAVRIVYQPDAAGVAGMDTTAPVDELRHALTADTWTTSIRTSAVSGGIRIVETVDPPTNLRVTATTGTTISWAWSNDPDGYDAVFIRLDNGAAQAAAATLAAFTAANLEPGSFHTLCVWGRRGLVNSGEVCAQGQTTVTPTNPTKPPGPQNPATPPTPPPGTPPGGTFPITDPNPGGGTACGWIYVLSRADTEVGWVDVGLGDVPADQVGKDWRPPFAYVAGATYRLCFQLLCSGAQQGGSSCYTWVEPSSWTDGDPCKWDAPPAPSPVASLEVCGQANEIADVISGLRLTKAELYSHAFTPGPYGGDTAMIAGPAAQPGRLCYGTVFALGKLGAGAGVDAPGTHTVFTVAGWVLVPATPTSSYAAVVVGSNLEFLILFEPEANTCRIRVAALDFLGRRRTWDLSEAANDVIPQGVWTHVAVAYGNTAGTADGGISLWIDGAFRSGINLGPGFLLAPHNGFVQLGAQPNLAVAHWAFWDQLLTTTEVAGVANNDPAPTPSPPGTLISVATTLVVPGAYRAANGQSVKLPKNTKVLWKFIWRDANRTPPAASTRPLPYQGFDMVQNVYRADPADDGTYTNVAPTIWAVTHVGSPPTPAPGPVYDWCVYYGPGDQTMDGTVLEANMAAVYVQMLASTFQDVRVGPGVVFMGVTLTPHYTDAGGSGQYYVINVDIADTSVFHLSRYDDEATHTKPLLPAPLPNPAED